MRYVEAETEAPSLTLPEKERSLRIPMRRAVTNVLSSCPSRNRAGARIAAGSEGRFDEFPSAPGGIREVQGRPAAGFMTFRPGRV